MDVKRKVKIVLIIISAIVLIFRKIVWRRKQSQIVTRVLPDLGLSFDMPATWKRWKDEGDSKFAFLKRDSGFRGFIHHSDMGGNVSEYRKDLLLSNMEAQIIDAYDNVQLISQHRKERNVGGNWITTSLYSGEYKRENCYFYICGIQFYQTGEFFWGTFTAPVKRGENEIREWDAILDSARCNVQNTTYKTL